MAECRPISGEYTWQNCEDFQLPHNSVWYGRDDDGSDIFCGKAWCDGEEVPAKVIPNRRECRVIDNGCERVVPNCRKVLICRRDEGDNCHRRRDHCHRRNSSSSECDQEESTTTKKSTCCNNESKVLEKNVKSCSSSTTTIVKKNRHKKGGSDKEDCWYETRTRMVPKVTVQPRVRYIPKVVNERTVRYVQERYTVLVCGRRCCDSCESRESSETYRHCEPCNPCEPCEPCEPCGPCEPCEPCQPCEPCDPCDPCSSNRKNKTVVICEHSEEKKQSHGSRSKSPSRKIKWF